MFRTSRQRHKRRRQSSGQSSVELVAGMLAVVPLFLFLIDMSVMMFSNSVNDNLCKQAARAAGNQSTAAKADPAAGAVINKLLGPSRQSGSGVFRKIETLDDSTPPGNANAQNCVYGGGSHPNNVVVTTRLTIVLPVPFPFLPSQSTFNTRANVPIVALPAQ